MHAPAAPRRKITRREFAISSILSALAGVVFTVWFALGRFPASTPAMLAFGATAGFLIGLPFVFVEQLFGEWIGRLQSRLQLPVRLLAYLLAAFVGFGFSFPIAGLVIFQRVIMFPRQFPMLVAGSSAAIVGLGIYSYLILKERLEASLVRIKEQEFAERELELARKIQERLLPPPEVAGEGYRVVGRNIAAAWVAGDFYDVFHLSDGSLGLAVADVSGKGMGASLIMSTAKAMLPLLAAGRTVEDTLMELNTRLKRDLAKREFVALAFIRYEPRTGRAQIANAGLPDPFMTSGDGLVEIEVSGPRLPLGMMKDVRYESREIMLQPGDRLTVFTDGLPEAPAGNDEQLGYEGLRRIVESCSDSDAGAWIDAILGRIRGLTPGGPDDDCTALVLERVTSDSRQSAVHSKDSDPSSVKLRIRGERVAATKRRTEHGPGNRRATHG